MYIKLIGNPVSPILRILVVTQGSTITFSLWKMPELTNELTLQVPQDASTPTPCFALISAPSGYKMAIGHADGTLHLYKLVHCL